MALIGNYSVILKNPATFIGGTQVSNCRSAFNANGQLRQRYLSSDASCNWSGAGLPQGYLPPHSWLLPYKPGALSSSNASGSGTMSNAQGQNGRAATATLDGVGVVFDAAGGLIAGMVAAIAASGGLTADVVGALEAAADLAGSGTLAGAQSAVSGMVAALTGTGLLSIADLEALAQMTAAIYVNEGAATAQTIIDGIRPDLEVINDGVQKASLLIPHTTDL